MTHINAQKQFKKVLYITLALNLFVAIAKILVGNFYSYFSLTSSGLESLFDGSSNVLGLLAIHYAYRPADKQYQYGHYKYETLGSLVIAVLLSVSSFQIASDVYHVFRSQSFESRFGIVPILTILISMAVSFFVSKYEGKKGQELSSSILQADADHTFGDFIISGGVLLSIILSYFHLRWPDLIIGAVICLYLLWLALKIFKENIPHLMDASPEVSKEILEEIEFMPEVLDVHNFRARGSEYSLYIDFHILLERELPLYKAHRVSHELEDKIRKVLNNRFQYVDIIIHIEPYERNHHD